MMPKFDAFIELKQEHHDEKERQCSPNRGLVILAIGNMTIIGGITLISFREIYWGWITLGVGSLLSFTGIGLLKDTEKAKLSQEKRVYRILPQSKQ